MNRTIMKTSLLTRRAPMIISSRQTSKLRPRTHSSVRSIPLSSLPSFSNRTISTVPSSNSSSSSSTTTTTRTRPPRPPTHTTLPTLDVSPILDPTLYLKKYSKSIHKRCGSEASKRLFKAQSKIRNWVWDYNSYVDYDGTVPSREDTMCGGLGRGVDTRNGFAKMNSGSSESQKVEEQRKSLSFGLVGHGVPYQLFQDHVDTAWRLLVDQQQKRQQNLSGEKHAMIGNEIVECSFQNPNGDLKMDWMNIRNREGHTYSISNPLQNNSYGSISASEADMIDGLRHSVDLYLTVMNRLSRTFGTILQEPRNNNHNTISHNSKRYWKHDKSIPIQYWKATIKRGFEYPPSATMFSSDFLLLEDNFDIHGGSSSNNSTSGGASGKSKENDKDAQNNSTSGSNDSNKVRSDENSNTSISYNGNPGKLNPRVRRARCGYGEWTNPPIVELIDSTNQSMAGRGPSFVRVTIQGIPSFFWNESSSTTSTSTTATATTTASTDIHAEEVGTASSDKDKEREDSGDSGDDGADRKNGLEFDRDDMVPISLVFEACFHNGEK